MQVTIAKDSSQIEFKFPLEERSRYFRIEMDILRSLGYLSCRLVEPGFVRCSQEPFRSQFTAEQVKTITEILKGYCLSPTIV